MRVIANAKIASPKDTRCSRFTLGTKASVDIYQESVCSNYHNKSSPTEEDVIELIMRASTDDEEMQDLVCTDTFIILSSVEQEEQGKE